MPNESNVRQLTDHGAPIYPITDRSLVIGLQDNAFATYVMAWDGASTPVPANIPAGVVVTYNGTDYTGTLAASASTAQDLYLVASGSQPGEYDRYITTHVSSTYAWNALGSTAIVSPVIADDLVTNDSSKALSAKQGKILGDKTSELEAKVTDLFTDAKDPIPVNSTASGWKLTGTGLCVADSSARMKKYLVTAGGLIYLKLSADNPGVYQFQSSASVPSTGTNANLVGTPVTDAVDGFVEVPSGATYLIVSELTTNSTNEVKTAVAYSLSKFDEDIAKDEYNFEKYKDITAQELTVAKRVSLEQTILNDLRVDTSTQVIGKVVGDYLYYVRIYNGQTVRGDWTFASGYVRFGMTRTIPAIGVPIEGVNAGGTGTTTHDFVATFDGYVVVSFTLVPTAISFSIANDGIGGKVNELQEDVAKISVFDGTIEGKGTTAVATNIPITKGRYNLHLTNFVRGVELSGYLLFRIKSGDRVVAQYYYADVPPVDYYFDVLEGETSLEIYSRSATNFSVRISNSDNYGIFDFIHHDAELLRIRNTKKFLETSGPTFTMLHFSDIHGDSVRLSRILQYFSTFKFDIDEILHTGDAVASTVTATSFDFWDECGAERVLNCIGNHDVWYTDAFTPPENYPYNTYFKPYIDGGKWGTIVQPEDAEQDGLCYFYKDYANGIRLIVLDYQGAYTSQMEWFADVLADSVTNGKAVIVAVHYPPTFTKGYGNSFDISDIIPVANTLGVPFMNAVNTFLGNGGEFVCWLTGHCHRDNTGYYQGTNGKQVIINIDCAAMRNDSGSRYRAENSKSQDAFNILTVNTARKVISVFRVGNDCDALQRHIGSMCIKYDTAELIASN